ncbi:hypothetical protein [Nocardioides sp. SYSU D00038]|uniref:DUF7485 domain-containing protein n=1 Tax=Nocardioides sp. SYSU D00038 TaxID=2812554 RepID=UPI001967957C|nr:hypothetical protein [Nocardioides sp. SYSU D00038]
MAGRPHRPPAARAVLLAGLLLAALLLAACSSDRDPSSSPTATRQPVSSDASASTDATPTATAAGERDLDVDRLVVPAASSGLPPGWRERFVVPYGPGPESLGTAPGGDSGSLDLGPEYGAPAPDGTWWFLDAAKRRLAHHDADGRYLGAVRLGPDLLVDGTLFQWQLPHVLDDGTLVAARQEPDRTWLLRLRDGRPDQVAVDGSFAPTYSDGRLLYGSSAEGRPVAVDPADGSLRRVAAYRTPSGTPFTLTPARRLRLALPDVGVARALPLVTASGAPAHVGLQVRAGADDVLHVFLTGVGEDDESVQLVGATSIDPRGRVAEPEALPTPFPEADPGSPAQLVLAPGSSTPALVYVLPDGVHVLERTRPVDLPAP